MKENCILLISANRFCDPYPVYPIGVSYLSTHLKASFDNYKIIVFDLNLAELSDLKEIFENNNVLYTGVSFRNIDDNNIYEKSSFLNWYKEIVDEVKKLSNSTIIIGGAGFSIFPEYLLDFLNVNFGVKGEGEKSLVELIKAIDSNTDYTDIQGLVYRTNSNIIVNPRNEYLNNLELDFNEDSINYYWDQSGMLNIQTKRGCPKQCIYCSYPVIEGREIRTLNIDKIITTLTKLYKEKKINYVFFTDSIFNIKKEYNKELCERIIESGIKVKWGAYFTPDAALKYEDLELYKKAGLKHVEFGTDALCDDTLKTYRKSFRLKEVIEKSEFCNDLGIYHAHFLILGGYGETNETLAATFENSKKIDRAVFFPYIGMRIYPNTALYDVAVEDGYIDKDNKLLEPFYYVAKDVDLSNVNAQAKATGQTWVMPDDPHNDIMDTLRARKKRGPLWEYLRF